MRLTFDEATEQFRSEVATWLGDHAPSADEMRADPSLSTAHLPGWAKRWYRDQFDAGLLVPGYPPEWGGRNATPVQAMVYFEELARRGVPRTPNPQSLSIIAPSIVELGTDAQKEQYALPILRGDKTGCLGMSEPGAGSDLAGLTTRAVLDGDHFVVNGQKVWTSGAHHADFCFCFVRTDPDVPKHKGISLLIIDMDTPGISWRPLPHLVDPHEHDFNEVFFTDVVVPRENLVGELNEGWSAANRSLAHERGMMWIDQASLLHAVAEHLVSLTTGEGPGGRRLADDALVRDQVAGLYIDAQALKFMGYRGFAKITRGQASPEHSVLKLFGTETARKMYLTAAETLGPAGVVLPDQPVHGGRSMDSNMPWVHRYFTAFAGTIAGGTSEIQRNIVAERVLGLPRR